MNKIKKFGALFLALVMILALSVPAFADGEASMAGEAGIIGEFVNPDTPEVQNKAVLIQKELTVYNPANSIVNAPTITYTYTLTAGTADKEIFDIKTAHNSNANAHAYTKAGIVTGANVNGSVNRGTTWTQNSPTVGTLVFTPAVQLTATSTGYKNAFPVKVDFSGVTFTGAGVYRYVLTENATSYNSSGVVDGAISNVRYLDVYVKDGSTPGTYDIYGYVCFINDNNIDAQVTPTATTPNTVIAAAKTEGFVATTTGGDDGATTQTADEYYTYNLTIKKALVNDQAKNSNQFPFKVQFANTTVTDAVLPIVSGENTYTAPTLTAGNINNFTIDGTSATATQQLKIAKDGTVTFTGIPVGTTATIDEYNNVTGTIYTTKTSGGTTNESEGITLSWNAWASADTANWTTVTALQKTANDNTVKADANMTVTFTNTLLTISPTGVVLRVAPYVLMLAAGVVLLVLSRKRKKAADAA